MKYNYNYKYIFLTILLLLTIYLISCYLRAKSIENFEDMFADHEKYEEIYDTEFVNLYEIIYRDFTDIDYDTNIVYNKTLNNIKTNNDVSFLICGCGVGKLCKKIKY